MPISLKVKSGIVIYILSDLLVDSPNERDLGHADCVHMKETSESDSDPYVIETSLPTESLSPYSHETVREAWTPTATTSATDDITALEEFSFDGVGWKVYTTDEGYIYYLSDNSHSQWGDPRVYGTYCEEFEATEYPSFQSPRSPPSPRRQLDRASLRVRSVSTESSADDEDIDYVRTPMKSYHAMYKTPRKEIASSVQNADPLTAAYEEPPIGDISNASPSAVLEEEVLTGQRDDSHIGSNTQRDSETARENTSDIQLPCEILAENLWRMSKFNAVSAESRSSKLGNADAVSPRRKLILYNVMIGLSQLKSIGSYETIFENACSLNINSGRMTADHLETLLRIVPINYDTDYYQGRGPAHHPAEDFLEVAYRYYPDLPNCVCACLICSTLPSQLSTIKSQSQALIKGCDQVFS